MRGSIRRGGKGTWRIEVSLGYDPVTKKRVRDYETFRGTKAEAEIRLSAMLHALDTGTELKGERITVAEYLERWLDHARTRVRPRTWVRYESLVRVHVVPLIGTKRLSKVRATDLQAVLDHMTKGGQSARSVVQCHRVVSAALRQAQRWQIIAVNPAAAVQPPKPERPALTIPTPADMAAVVAGARGTDYEAPFTVAVATGLRRGELVGLRWRDVDLDAARVRVTGTLQRYALPGGGVQLLLSEPKTQRARREVALPPFAVDCLRRQRAAQAQRRLQLGAAWQDQGYVFDAGDGRPIDPDILSSAFRRVCAAAGLKGVRFHDLRHGYATTLLTEGVHPKIASEALGHSTVAFTLDTYSHVVQGLQDRAAEAIEKAFGEASAVNPPSNGEAF